MRLPRYWPNAPDPNQEHQPDEVPRQQAEGRAKAEAWVVCPEQPRIPYPTALAAGVRIDPRSPGGDAVRLKFGATPTKLNREEVGRGLWTTPGGQCAGNGATQLPSGVTTPPTTLYFSPLSVLTISIKPENQDITDPRKGSVFSWHGSIDTRGGTTLYLRGELALSYRKC